jgi:hypothetical protein
MNTKKPGYSLVVVILIIVVLIVLGIKGTQKAFDAAQKAGERDAQSGQGAVIKGYVQGGVEGMQEAIAKNAGDKALVDAVRNADPEAVRFALSMDANPNTRASSGGTPLHRAAARNLIDIAHMLLEHGARADIGNPKSITPLHLAAGNGHVEMVELLIDYDANFNPKNDDGHTPLAMALQGFAATDSADKDKRKRYEKTIDLLRSWGAK